MKMKCPFCKSPITFEKIIEGEVHPCPMCNRPIKMEHLSWWKELKGDCKDVWSPIDKWCQTHTWWLLIGATIAVSIALFSIWPNQMLAIVGVMLAITFLGWLFCHPEFWKAVGYIIAILVGIALLLTPVGWIFLLMVFLCWLGAGCCERQSISRNSTQNTIHGNNNRQTNQTAYGNNNFNTYHFTFHNTTLPRVVKCAHCGASRPDVMDSCPGCGSRNTK